MVDPWKVYDGAGASTLARLGQDLWDRMYNRINNTYVKSTETASFKISTTDKLTKLILLNSAEKLSLVNCLSSEKYCCEMVPKYYTEMECRQVPKCEYVTKYKDVPKYKWVKKKYWQKNSGIHTQIFHFL